MSASLRVDKMIHEEYVGLAECFQNYGIVKAAIFGSTARGETNPDSDLDLIVSFGEKYDLLDLVGLITYDALKDNNFSRSVL